MLQKVNIQKQIDPCAKSGKRLVANLVLCSKRDKEVHGRCAKMRRVTSTLAKSFLSVGCGGNKRNCETRQKIVILRPGGVSKEFLLLGEQTECQCWK